MVAVAKDEAVLFAITIRAFLIQIATRCACAVKALVATVASRVTAK